MMSDLTDALDHGYRMTLLDPRIVDVRGFTVDELALILDAARRVAEADDIGWCEIHDASIPEWAVGTPLGPKCWRYIGVQVVEDLPEDACQMVRRPLLKSEGDE